MSKPKYTHTYYIAVFDKGPKIHNGEETISSTNSVDKTGYQHTEEWNLTIISSYRRSNLIWVKELKLRSGTIKLLGKNLHDIGLGNEFLEWPQKQAAKGKIDELDYI